MIKKTKHISSENDRLRLLEKVNKWKAEMWKEINEIQSNDPLSSRRVQVWGSLQELSKKLNETMWKPPTPQASPESKPMPGIDGEIVDLFAS